MSANYDGGGGGEAVGGGSATGGGSSTGGGGVGGGTGTGGGSATGGGAGGGAGSCTSTGASAACPSGALFCDNFNDGTLRAAWAVEQLNGTVEPSAECVYQGARALRSQLTAVGATVAAHALVTEADSGTPLPGAQFLRAMVRLDSPVPDAAVKLIAVKQGSPGTGSMTMQYQGGNLALVASGGTAPTATAAFPLDTWVCVEWQLEEGSPGATRVWLNGASAAAIDGAFTVTELKTVTLGAQLGDHAAAVGVTTAYFDEVVVGTARVGCP